MTSTGNDDKSAGGNRAGDNPTGTSAASPRSSDNLAGVPAGASAGDSATADHDAAGHGAGGHGAAGHGAGGHGAAGPDALGGQGGASADPLGGQGTTGADAVSEWAPGHQATSQQASGRSAIDERTREMPEYARGRARPTEPLRSTGGAAGADPESETGVGWPDEAGEIGRPLDAGRFDGAAREELSGRRSVPAGRGCLFGLAAVIVALAVLVFGLRSVGLWPHLSNPFAEQKTDRSQPPLLKSIQDLSRFTAAQGNFQVVIDLQNDRKFVPDFLLNHRTLFVGVGSVEAYVDFSTISQGAIVESADGTSVEIKLPAPQLGEPNLDIKNSYVFAEQRGLFNRIGDAFSGDPNQQKETYQRAEEAIGAAARDTELAQRAQENTRKMLEGLLRSLGYQKVTVTFATP